MTLLIVLVVGASAILIISAIENVSLGQTFQGILNGSEVSAGNIGTIISGVVKPPTQQSTATSINLGGLLTLPNVQAQPWLAYHKSLGYGQNATGVANTGIDFGTPFHTAITALMGGQVVSATYSPQIGGQVLVAFQLAGQTLYAAYVHLDQIRVQVGQNIAPGQLVGLSGGQLSGGTHNAQYPYSTGPHTLFGIFKAPAASFANSLDPTGFIDYLRSLLGVAANA